MKNTIYIERPRINTILSPIFDYPLTILEAPMGYGKTTAVKKFLEKETAKVIWITFSDLNQSQNVLWERFSDKIGTIDAKSGATLKSLGFPSTTPQMESVFLVLSNIHLEERFLFVLDDYQNTQNENLTRLIMSLAQEEIDGLHLLIITRDTSNIDFVELLSKGICYLITKNQLKFTKTELYSYCKTFVDTIPEKDMARIFEYTDGWISFAYIILLGLVNHIPIGMSTPIEDLIDKALFSIYPNNIQNFLLRISIMEEFTTEQAEFVTRESNARQFLKKLYNENTFIQYDSRTGIYTIHHVLLDFLRINQNFTVEETNALYRRLSDWYIEKKEYQLAYGFLYHIGETERILAHANNNIQNTPFTFTGAPQMFNMTSRELLLKYPFAYLVYIIFGIISNVENDVLSWEKRLDEIEMYYMKLEGIDEVYRNRVLGETLIVRIFTHFNDITKMKSYSEEIKRLLNGQNSYITFKEDEFTFGSPHHLYIYYRDIGSLKYIAGILSGNVGYAEFSGGCGTGSDSLAAAEYALETGQFETVELRLNEAWTKANIMSQTFLLISINFCYIRLRIMQGRLTEALSLLQQSHQQYGALNNSLLNTTLDLCMGYVYASIGHTEQIPAWLQIGDMSEADFMYQGIAYNYLVYGKALMAMGKFIELEALIIPFRQYFSAFNNQLGHIHNKIFEAAAKYQLRGADMGIACLEAALKEAEPDKLIMPFVESSSYILEMLQIILQRNPDNEYVKRLIPLCNSYMQTILGLPDKNVEMTQREISILSLAASGLKRKDIADHLFISEETVKSHFKNIYQKLEVNSKLSAIKLAQARGYLEA